MKQLVVKGDQELQEPVMQTKRCSLECGLDINIKIKLKLVIGNGIEIPSMKITVNGKIL